MSGKDNKANMLVAAARNVMRIICLISLAGRSEHLRTLIFAAQISV
tara:strand:- start:19870 stop:20007 length:138 start_codon:yes stop_codon:yes gene_type:complete